MIFAHANGRCNNCLVDFTNFDPKSPYECTASRCSSEKLEGFEENFDLMRFNGDINTTFLTNFVKISQSVSHVEFRRASTFNQITWIDICEWSNLIELTVQASSVKTLKSRFLYNCRDLDYLDLSNNMITDIAPDAFENLTKLTLLNLNYNQLKTLPKDTFHSLIQLKWLYLGSNQLEDLHKDAFYNLTDMDWLDLRENQLKTLDKDMFKSFNKLRLLRLGGNQLQSIASLSYSQYSSRYPNICVIEFYDTELSPGSC